MNSCKKKMIYIYIYIFYNRKTLLKTKTGQNKIAKGLSTNLLMSPSRLHLQQQKGYLSQKIQKQKLSIDYLVKECAALFASQLTQLTLVFAKFKNFRSDIILNY